MIRILVCLPHYERHNRGYILRTLQEFVEIEKSGEFKLDIHLSITADIKFPYNLNITNHLFDKEIGYDLTRRHRATMEELRGQYDLYMYFEDDVLITLNNLRYYMRNLKKIKDKGLDFRYVPGFNEYENRGDNLVEKQLVQIHSGIPFIGTNRYDPEFNKFFMDSFEMVLALVDEEYFELASPVQGGYLITSEQLDWILDNRRHQFFTINFQGVPESAASDVFDACGLRRILSRYDWEDSLVYHQRNWLWSIGWSPVIGINELIKLVNDLYLKYTPPAGDNNFRNNRLER